MELKAADFHCSFCGRGRKDVKLLVTGPMVFICDACYEAGREQREPISKCSFCGCAEERRGQQSPISQTTICENCLEVVRDCIAERR
jgi:ATP-dependent protease Clp ATPase subunit